MRAETDGTGGLARTIVDAATGRAGALDQVPGLPDAILAAAAAADLPSPLPLAELASAAVAGAVLAAESLARARADGAEAPTRSLPAPALDGARITASYRSEQLLAVDGARPNAWAPASGYFATADGWVRTHANYPHHALALGRLLALPGDADPDAILAAVRTRRAAELEERAASVGAVVGAVRTAAEWAQHPQHAVLRGLPLVRVTATGGAPPLPPPAAARRTDPAALPLTGIRVLDLTRVIAGPVATRALAAYGADVLRVDPPGMPELPSQHLDTGHGKRTALLDVADPAGAAALAALLQGADVLVTGYRPGALARFGLDPATLRARHPHLVTASVDAWGPAGPWAARRGFDSIVQAVTGIAELHARDGAPGAMPAQALDHTAGHLLAAGVLRALERRHLAGEAAHVGVSLAGVAEALLDAPRGPGGGAVGGATLAPGGEPVWRGCTVDLPAAGGRIVRTARPALSLGGRPLEWAGAASPAGTDAPRWRAPR